MRTQPLTLILGSITATFTRVNGARGLPQMVRMEVRGGPLGTTDHTATVEWAAYCARIFYRDGARRLAVEMEDDFEDGAEFDGPVSAAFAGAQDPESFCRDGRYGAGAYEADVGAMNEPGDDPDYDWDCQC